MQLKERIAAVQAKIAAAALGAGRDPKEITLCAATKVQTDDTIRAATATGIRVCGENRVQELTAHLEAGAYAGAQVHFIGHLQTNKVKQVVGRVELIQSVDSLHLLQAIDAQAGKLGLVQDILLEVNVGNEESKSGFAPSEVFAAAERARELDHVALRGLMTIPPAASAPGENLPYFQEVARLYIDIGEKLYDNKLSYLSMGMSDDFEDAIAAGATLIRVGSAIFGRRNYFA